MTSKKQLVLLDQMIFSGGSFMMTMLLARVLGPDDFGYYSSIVLCNYGLISLFSALVIQPFQVSVAKFTESTYTSFSFWMQMSLVTIVILTAIIIWSSGFKPLGELIDLPIGIAFFFGGFVMHDYFRKAFLAKQQISIVLFTDCLSVSLQVIASLVFWFGSWKSIAEITLVLGLTYLPGFIISVVFIKPTITDLGRWAVYAREHIRQGKWLLVTTVLQWWSGNIFVVASGVILGVRTLGVFRLVQSLFGVLSLLFQTFENYALPEASRILSISPAQARLYLRNISAQAAIGFGIILVLLSVFATEAITLIGGPEYADYAFIIQGMAMLYALIFIGYPIRISIRILVMNRVFFIGYLFAFVFSLLSYKYLLNRWDVSGVIAGLIFSQLILIIYWQYMLVKKQFILWK